MAKGHTFDYSEITNVLSQLAGPVKESLARRMLVSGGVLLRDEAKLLAPVGGEYEEGKTGSNQPGTLRDSIYLAYSDNKSTTTFFEYHITWNDKKAFWGKMIEFGHWMPYAYARTPGTNKFRTLKRTKLAGQGKRIPARPFLAPAYDNKIGTIKEVMLIRGRAELPILLQGIKQ